MKSKVPVSNESCEGHAMHYKIFTGIKIPMIMMTEKYSSKILMDTKIPSIRPSGVKMLHKNLQKTKIFL